MSVQNVVPEDTVLPQIIEKCQPGGTRWKIRESPKSLEFILLWPWLSVILSRYPSLWTKVLVWLNEWPLAWLNIELILELKENSPVRERMQTVDSSVYTVCPAKEFLWHCNRIMLLFLCLQLTSAPKVLPPSLVSADFAANQLTRIYPYTFGHKPKLRYECVCLYILFFIILFIYLFFTFKKKKKVSSVPGIQ